MFVADPSIEINKLPNRNAFVASETQAYYTRDMFMVGALTEL